MKEAMFRLPQYSLPHARRPDGLAGDAAPSHRGVAGNLRRAYDSFRKREVLLPGVLLAISLWAYWPSLTVMAHRWHTDAQYSHGYLVPLFSLAFLWSRRRMLANRSRVADSRGMPFILVGVTMQVCGAYYYFEWLELISIIPILLGIAVLCGGSVAWQWSWSAILFLFFMVPLPYTLDVALSAPLRMIGTAATTYLLQTAGLTAFSEGNVITVGEVQLGVAEACSGMRMLMIFFALSTAIAMGSRRTTLERFVVVASAIPIALIANICRITSTGLLHASGHAVIAGVLFHDLAGWVMMPLALVLLQCELYYLRKIFLVEPDVPMTVGVAYDRRVATPARTSGIINVA